MNEGQDQVLVAAVVRDVWLELKPAAQRHLVTRSAGIRRHRARRVTGVVLAGVAFWKGWIFLAGWLTILMGVEKSHIPFPDEPPIHFPKNCFAGALPVTPTCTSGNSLRRMRIMVA